MSRRSSLMHTLCFSAVYVVATYAGRLTVMDATNLSLVWPAAGVSAVWFLAQYRSRWRAVDVAALAIITVVVNTAIGASFVLAMWFVVANLVQAGLFAVLDAPVAASAVGDRRRRPPGAYHCIVAPGGRRSAEHRRRRADRTHRCIAKRLNKCLI